MLDRNERQFFTGADPASIVNAIGASLSQAGIYLQPSGFNAWAGRAQNASYGFVPKVMVSAQPIPNGFFLDIRVTPDFDTNGIVIFVVAWLFFFPVAIILAVLGYQDWQNRQQQLFAAIWGPVANRIAPPPAPVWGPNPQ
jgi:hypothetical protein